MDHFGNIASSIVPGRYVAAVSGGVDSMVLLNLLAGASHLNIAVAHMDHGIRQDSAEDYQLVQTECRRLGVAFYGSRVRLGTTASEALAREVRYGFLRAVQQRVGGQGIITAHHQDDLVETMAIQMLRGTSRRGLSTMTGKNIVRPFLGIKKKHIYDYAKLHGVRWREDSTNADPAYMRNRLRLGPLNNADAGKMAVRKKLLAVHQDMTRHNEAIDAELLSLDGWLRNADGIVRWRFAQLPHAVARDYLAFYLRGQSVPFDAPLLERLTVALKVQKPHTKVSIGVNRFVEIYQKTAQLLVQ